MVNYEGVFILNPDLTQDASKSVVTQVQELVTKQGGRVEGLQEWGKRRMAYKINKKQDGNYVLVNFQLESDKTKKLESLLKLNDNLLRFMLINKDDL